MSEDQAFDVLTALFGWLGLACIAWGAIGKSYHRILAGTIVLGWTTFRMLRG